MNNAAYIMEDDKQQPISAEIVPFSIKVQKKTLIVPIVTMLH